MGNASKTETTLTSVEINKFHRKLESGLREVLGNGGIEIGEGGGRETESWSAARNGPVWFCLRNRYGGYTDRAGGGPSRGHVMPVVVLPIPSDIKRKVPPLQWWVALSNSWNPRGQKEFAFKSIAWALFCSEDGGEKTLVLRAEWDLPCAEDGSMRNAGQPHWHVHHEVQLGDGASWGGVVVARDIPGTPRQSGLVEEAAGDPMLIEEPVNEVPRENVEGVADIHEIHLGMGGWRHSGDVPMCWQHPLGVNIAETLRAWCLATLTYMQTQVCYAIYPAAGRSS